MVERQKEVRKVIDRIVKKLVADYTPQQVILFGSYAYGDPGPHSDIDLLIIKDTPEPFFDRLATVRRILGDAHRSVSADILVYTLEEIKCRLTIGDQFIQEILDKGEVLYGEWKGEKSYVVSDESLYPAEWLSFAETDLRRVGVLLGADDPAAAGFFLQQAVEKFLKAFLLSRGWRLQRTHNLDDLLNDAVAYDASLEGFRSACRTITDFYLRERYPSSTRRGLTEEEVRGSLEEVRGLIEKARASISEK